MKFISTFQEAHTQMLRDMEAERAAYVSGLEAQGWWMLEFVSEYYGSHDEYGEGDIAEAYFFHPSIPVQWQGTRFKHGHHGASEENTRFEEWLKSLPEDRYVSF
jgi:hypothetical protein